MLIYQNPRRTRLLLRIRRLVFARTKAERKEWPDEAIQELVNKDMKGVSALPMRKVRQIHQALAQANV